MADLRIRLLSELMPAGVDGLPTEFRIFQAGENPSTKGSVWFDDRSAALVMAEAQRHDVDQIIDLEHYSVRPRLVDVDSTDTDARGYYRPELRAGELWANGVNWTDDGAARLRSRRQRYTSPAFLTEKDPKLNDGAGGERVIKLLNVALCSMPATYGLDPLVRGSLDSAKSSVYGRHVEPRTLTNADREEMAKALAALDGGDANQCRQILTTALASGGVEDDAAPDSSADGSGNADADKKHPPMDQAYSAQILALAPGTATLFAALTALIPRCLSVTGAADLAGAAAFVTKLIADKSAAETAELRSLITELVTLGAETPATAWANNAPVPRLASEGLESLRARTAALRATKPTTPTPPPVAGGEQIDGEDVSMLSDGEREYAKTEITDPSHRKRFIAAVKARATRTIK